MRATQASGLADRWGVPVLRATPAGMAAFNRAVESLLALAGDPVAETEAAVAAAPDMVLAQVYRAYLSLYGMTADGVAAAAVILDGLDGAGAEREALHLRAARAWAAGDWTGAARALERALVAHPRDALALKVAQDLYFFLGRRLDLRDVAARVLAHWPPGQPGWGYVQGIYAFGLEENGDYRAAQARAEAALAVNPRDVWSVHAVAHVHEMEGRHRDGVAFLTATAPDWQDSYFAVHNWWHRGLYHLELGETGAALELYDGQVRARRSLEWLDLVDAAALLWRLALYGADLGDRAARLADDIEPLLESAPVYVFNDWHAVMAFGLDGRNDRCARVLADNQRLATGTNRARAERAGLALLRGFGAFAAGRFDDALDQLIDIRDAASAVGGSHAQRDVIDLTLIAAAARAGDRRLARALAGERTARKPSATASAEQLLAVSS
ncbi:MAG TPA: tetratricopeptide repeat protein [Streptosporangiaceae bacterium]|nr:tetratricopeptide repeat protein [Streptosporangiaceae bacterium]